MGDHTECFQVDFDPSVVSYEELLGLFWQSHDPTRASWKTQYASLVLAHDDAQLTAARESARRYERTFGGAVVTRIALLGEAWMAEDYHQKYYLRNDRTLMPEFRAMYPRDADFVASTAAMRANGYLAGNGGKAQLDGEIDLLGLSDKGREHLRSKVSGGLFGGGCAL
jgi:peptide-methionine (S)-S-oxide reductase